MILSITWIQQEQMTLFDAFCSHCFQRGQLYICVSGMHCAHVCECVCMYVCMFVCVWGCKYVNVLCQSDIKDVMFLNIFVVALVWFALAEGALCLGEGLLICWWGLCIYCLLVMTVTHLDPQPLHFKANVPILLSKCFIFQSTWIQLHWNFMSQLMI